MAQKIKSSLKETSVLSQISIDYPREGEKIMPGHYAIRISALPGAEVELSINEGNSQTCRWAVGYYWLDWSPSTPGQVVLTARSRSGKGRWKKADDRTCTIIGPGTN